MKHYITPPGKAGSDKLYGMEETIQSDIRAMFQAGAERDALDYGVGSTVDERLYQDGKVILRARRRELDARITWTAGKAIERALQLIYAHGTDRIMGREFPDVDVEQLKKDVWRGHDLSQLRERIIEDMPDRDMTNALEDAYQKALNPGFLVVTIDNEEMWTTFVSPEDVPLREEVMSGTVSDGAEYTLDHSSFKTMLFRGTEQSKSEFSQLPSDTLEQFLTKADQSYYERTKGDRKRRNMSWAFYSSRDHEFGRPYVVAGMKFFARLTKEFVELAKQPWVSDRGRLIRRIERANYNIQQLMEGHALQRFHDKIDFPPMIPAEEIADEWRAFPHDVESAVKNGYDRLRKKQPWVRKPNAET